MQITKSQRDRSPLNKCVGNSTEMLEGAHEREIIESKNCGANDQSPKQPMRPSPSNQAPPGPLSLLSGASASHPSGGLLWFL